MIGTQVYTELDPEYWRAFWRFVRAGSGFVPMPPSQEAAACESFARRMVERSRIIKARRPRRAPWVRREGGVV